MPQHNVPTEDELSELVNSTRALQDASKRVADAVFAAGGAKVLGERISNAAELARAEILRAAHLLTTWVSIRRSMTRAEAKPDGF